jgi:hypothetical protein
MSVETPPSSPFHRSNDNVDSRPAQRDAEGSAPGSTRPANGWVSFRHTSFKRPPSPGTTHPVQPSLEGLDLASLPTQRITLFHYRPKPPKD